MGLKASVALVPRAPSSRLRERLGRSTQGTSPGWGGRMPRGACTPFACEVPALRHPEHAWGQAAVMGDVALSVAATMGRAVPGRS